MPEGFAPIVHAPVHYPIPTPVDQGYRPNPFIRSPLPGLSDPDSQRQFYGRNGVQIKRFLPLSNG